MGFGPSFNQLLRFKHGLLVRVPTGLLGPHYGPLIGLIGLYQVIFLEVQTEHVLRAGSSPDSF